VPPPRLRQGLPLDERGAERQEAGIAAPAAAGRPDGCEGGAGAAGDEGWCHNVARALAAEQDGIGIRLRTKGQEFLMCGDERLAHLKFMIVRI
jgi:hypothetical protein